VYDSIDINNPRNEIMIKRQFQRALPLIRHSCCASAPKVKTEALLKGVPAPRTLR